MSYQNDRFKFSLASSSDSAQILELFEAMDFSGDISVLFTRRPNPYDSLMSEGEEAIIPIVRDTKDGTICAMGCCIIRKAFINGEVRNIGYLTGLKIREEYKSILYMFKNVYKFLYENTKEKVDIYYTTILEDNKNAQKLLEKKRKGMPVYKYEGDYTVYCFSKSAYNLKVKDRNLKEYKFEASNKETVKEFYNNNLDKYNFSSIDIDLYCLTDDDFFILRNKDGDIIAACALWNQKSYKQYIITNYSGIFKYISKISTKWLGYPSFPKKNVPINYASISLFFIKDMDLEIAEYFLRKVTEHDNKYDILMLGFFETHPFTIIFNKIKHIKYNSRFYRVDWNGEFLELDEKPINVEVGLL